MVYLFWGGRGVIIQPGTGTQQDVVPCPLSLGFSSSHFTIYYFPHFATQVHYKRGSTPLKNWHLLQFQAQLLEVKEWSSYSFWILSIETSKNGSWSSHWPNEQLWPKLLLVLVDWVSRTRDKKDSLFHLEVRIYLMKGNAEQLWAIHTIYHWEIVGLYMLSGWEVEKGDQYQQKKPGEVPHQRKESSLQPGSSADGPQARHVTGLIRKTWRCQQSK